MLDGNSEKKPMLKKIESIKNLGKFRNYSGDLEFKKLNLIYADNGLGKTTLTSIFRSLSDNNPGVLVGRKTIGQPADPEVTLAFDEQKVRFLSQAWDQRKEIEIFDTRFIQDNIYFGDSVASENKRALYKFVVGRAGVQLAHDVDAVDIEIKTINAEALSNDKLLKATIKSGMTTEHFMRLTPAECASAEKEIPQIENDLVAAKKVSEVQSKAGLREVAMTLPDPSVIQEVLYQKIENLSEEALGLAIRKISALGSDSTKWLAHGLQYAKGDNCPFCDSPTAGNKLVQSFQAYFTEQYRTYSEKLRKLRGGLVTESLLQIETAQQVNAVSSEYWGQFMALPPLPSQVCPEIKEAAFASIQMCLALIASREQNLNEDLQLQEPIQKLKDLIQGTQELLEKYNSAVRKINQQINDYKTKLGRADSTDLGKRLLILTDKKNRFSAKTNLICQNIADLKEQKKGLEKVKFEKRAQLDAYSKEIFPKYQQAINHYLAKFECTFSISGKTSSHAGGKPGTSYKLVINDVVLDVGDSETSDEIPSFRNTLSEGEKCTLAFCYFLARFEVERALDSKIVVLDDPLASFDDRRRSLVKKIILNLASKVSQVLVFSHDQAFLRLIFKDAPTAAFLCIQNGAGGSQLESDSKPLPSEDFRTEVKPEETYAAR